MCGKPASEPAATRRPAFPAGCARQCAKVAIAFALCGNGSVFAFQLPLSPLRVAPVPGQHWPGRSNGGCAPPAWAQSRGTKIVLGVSLDRYHNFDIKKEKVDALFDKIEELGLSMADVEEKFVRGSGAGGQKINKTNSNVQMTHAPTGLQSECQRERQREKNRFIALRALVDKIEAQLKGGSGMTKEEKKIAALRKQKARKKRRSSSSSSSSSSSKKTAAQPEDSDDELFGAAGESESAGGGESGLEGEGEGERDRIGAGDGKERGG